MIGSSYTLDAALVLLLLALVAALGGGLLVFAVLTRRLRLLGLRKSVVDLVAGRTIIATHELELEPYDLMILARPVPAAAS